MKSAKGKIRLWSLITIALDLYGNILQTSQFSTLKTAERIDRYSHIVPIPSFPDAKNHKTQTFSRKIRGLCLLNVAVKESRATGVIRFSGAAPKKVTLVT
jgi:RIO-like serine/threonine protein kinase